MLKLYFLLYYEFFKIGIFAIGGGYATLPFLYFLQSKYNWFSLDELTNMIAVSNITPGPIGINMATYTGYTTAGILGSVITTTAIITAPFITAVIIMKLINKFKSCREINYIFKGLRPASCALLISIGLKLLYQTITFTKEDWSFPVQFDYHAIILFIILILPFSFMKKRPLLVILAGAIFGIILK